MLFLIYVKVVSNPILDSFDSMTLEHEENFFGFIS